MLYLGEIENNFKLHNRKGKIVNLQLLARDKSIKVMSDPRFNAVYLRDYRRAVIIEGEEISGALAIACILTGLIGDGEPKIKHYLNRQEVFTELMERIEGDREICGKDRMVKDMDALVDSMRGYLVGKGVDGSYFLSPHYP